MRFALIALIALAIVGCNSEDTNNLKRDAGALADTAGKAAVNAQLAARVNAALLQRKGVDISGLHIEARNGVVMVGGHVRDADEKQRVLDTVKDTRGVDRIDDQLRIQASK